MCNSIKDGKRFRCGIYNELYYVLIKNGWENSIYGKSNIAIDAIPQNMSCERIKEPSFHTS